MKIFIGLCLSMLISVVVSTIGIHNCDGEIVSTLYTVLGIIFSVGMSLLISVPTTDIKDIDAKSEYRKQLKRIRNRFIIVFIIQTALYIYLYKKEVSAISITLFYINPITILFNKNLFLVLGQTLSLLYYIVNFYDIQGTVYKIEDRIEESVSKDGGKHE